jgi:FkbM family methyltransferase
MRPHLALASVIIIAISLSGLFGAAIWEWHEREALGQLHFPISCSAASQRLFNFATARLHSLNFNEAESAYSTIAQAEADCAIAYWGSTMLADHRHKGLRVETRTLASILADYPVILMKMDVQGAEEDILRQSRSLTCWKMEQSDYSEMDSPAGSR